MIYNRMTCLKQTSSYLHKSHMVTDMTQFSFSKQKYFSLFICNFLLPLQLYDCDYTTNYKKSFRFCSQMVKNCHLSHRFLLCCLPLFQTILPPSLLLHLPSGLGGRDDPVLFPWPHWAYWHHYPKPGNVGGCAHHGIIISSARLIRPCYLNYANGTVPNWLERRLPPQRSNVQIPSLNPPDAL